MSSHYFLCIHIQRDALIRLILSASYLFTVIDNLHGDEDDEITQEDAWEVISSFFDIRGLVRQQLDSFQNFAKYTIQEIIGERDSIEIRPRIKYNVNEISEREVSLSVSVRIIFFLIF